MYLPLKRQVFCFFPFIIPEFLCTVEVPAVATGANSLLAQILSEGRGIANLHCFPLRAGEQNG
jgi:hypothetical protein